MLMRTLDIERAAGLFAAIGAPARLAVLQTLVRAGTRGLSVGELRAGTDLPASTLAHHLTAMVRVGLVLQEKSGRNVMNRANLEQLQGLADYLLAECCQDEADLTAGTAA
jgi:DNA-binding transcriptional ArsR family regulator